MKQLLKATIAGLVADALFLVITSLATGQSLLSALRSQSLPLWMFLLLVFVTVCIALVAWNYWKSGEKPEVPLRIVWHPGQSYWHMSPSVAQFTIAATCTSVVDHPVFVVGARIMGKRNIDDIQSFACPPNEPMEATLFFHVHPSVAKEGRRWKGRVEIVDHEGNQYQSPKLEIPHH